MLHPERFARTRAAGLTAGAAGLYCSVRVNAGEYKGRVLSYPRSGLRPAMDRTRQAMFNIVGERVVGARVCDLFAGGGSLGIEALSRGAREAVFVERDAAVLQHLRGNTRGIVGAEVMRGDAVRALKRLADSRFDVVLAAPPYRCGYVQQVVDGVVGCGVVADTGLIVLEHHHDESPVVPEGWIVARHKCYGATEVTVLRRQDGQ